MEFYYDISISDPIDVDFNEILELQLENGVDNNSCNLEDDFNEHGTDYLVELYDIDPRITDDSFQRISGRYLYWLEYERE